MDNQRWNTIVANFALISAGITECLRVVLVDSILPLLLDDEEEDEDSSSDEEFVEGQAVPQCDHVDSVVSRQTDLQFREYFRLTRATFEILQEKLAASLNNLNQHPMFGGRPALDHRKMLLVTMWIFATHESYR